MELSVTAVVAQIINFLILVGLFWIFLSKPISKSIESRRDLMKKLEKAEELYKNKIAEAEKKAEEIINDAMQKADKLVLEAGMNAEKRQEEILQEAEKKAEEIINDAKHKTELMKKQLEEEFEESVKKVSMIILRKLLNEEPQIKENYFENVLKNLK